MSYTTAAYGAGVATAVWTIFQRRLRHGNYVARSSSSSSKYCCSLKDIQRAAKRIEKYVHKTPILTCGDLDEKAGAKLFFKCELFQKTGSFKIRGAANACFSLSDEKAKRGLVTHSSGNHAQAVAYAAKCRSIPAYIVMPNNAPIPKKNAVLHTYGARVFECVPTNEAREKLAEEKRKEYSAELIHPSNDKRVIAGQGTIGLELIQQIRDMCEGSPDLDAIIVPLGGGGMLSGITVAVKSIAPNVRVYGVEPENASDAKRAKEAGEAAWTGRSIHVAGPPKTCADGLRTVLRENNWPIVRDLVDEIFCVSEEDIIDAMELVISRMKLAIEPSAATGVALALSKEFRALGHGRIGVVLCGGNADYSPIFKSLREKFVRGRGAQ